MAFSDDEIYESFMEDTHVEKYASYDYKQGFTVIYRPFYKLYYDHPVPKVYYKEYSKHRGYVYDILYKHFRKKHKKLPKDIRKILVEGMRKLYLEKEKGLAVGSF